MGNIEKSLKILLIYAKTPYYDLLLFFAYETED